MDVQPVCWPWDPWSCDPSERNNEKKKTLRNAVGMKLLTSTTSIAIVPFVVTTACITLVVPAGSVCDNQR